MDRLLPPGVALERGDAARVPGVVLRTDVAAMVGVAERGPLDTAVPVESMRQFGAHFGGFIEGGYLAYAARGFFANGGRRLWIVRVAHRRFGEVDPGPDTARAAQWVLNDLGGVPALHLEASSPGSWGNALSLQWNLSGQAVTTGLPAQGSVLATRVRSVSGFAERELVRIEQGATVLHRVIAMVDAGSATLHWVHPDPERRRADALPLAGLDPTQPVRITRIAYALVLRERGEVVASWSDLHLAPQHPRFIGAVLRAPRVGDPLRQADGERAVPRPPPPVIAHGLGDGLLPLALTPGETLVLAGGSDGLAALEPVEFIGEEASPADSDFVRLRKTRGAHCLEAVDQVALLAMPDLLIRPAPLVETLPLPEPPHDPCLHCPPAPPPRAVRAAAPAAEVPGPFADDDIARVQAALVTLAERCGDRFVLLGVPLPLLERHQPREAAIAWRGRFDTRIAALYAPWLRVADPRVRGARGATRQIPACGHLLGLVAATDLAEGVQRAPAVRRLADLVGTSREVDDTTHALWNEAHVNVLRVQRDSGTVTGGARTLSHELPWRFVNVCRLVLAIRKACDIALRWTVFEPHDAELRGQVRATLLEILRLFHERGAFAGDSEATSFYVRCDEVTSPREAVDAGQLVAEVGIAPAAPAEFIVLRIGRQAGSPQVELFAPEEAFA